MKLHRRCRIGIALLLVLFVAGCGGGLLGSLFKITSAAAVLPSNWSSRGGIVGILADISGYTAVRKVVAMVKKLNDSEPAQLVELTMNEAGKFEGTYEADPNTEPTEADEYEVVVTATDDSGNVAASEPVEFEVPPAEEPPAAP